MTAPLEVRPGEARVVRVFALDMPPEQARFLRDEPAAVAQKLGIAEIDGDHADVIAIDDLDEIGLAGYLAEGVGVAPGDVAADRAMLDALTGHVLVVLSRAFGGQAVTLNPAADLRLVATYGQQPTDWTAAAPIDTDSARPGRVPPRQRRSAARRVGGSIFAVFMIAIAIILWAVLT